MKNKNIDRFFIYGFALLAIMGVSMVLPILPDIERKFSVTSAQAALVITAYTFPGVFVTLISGILADMFGKRFIILLGIFSFSAGGLLCAFADNFTLLLFYRVIQGIGGGVSASMYSSIIADNYEDFAMTKMMGQVISVTSLGMAFFPLFGGYLGEIAWNIPFYLCGLGFSLFILALYIKLGKKKDDFILCNYLNKSIKSLQNMNIFIFFLIIFLSYVIYYGAAIYFPSMANIRFMESSSRIGELLAIGALGSALMSYLLAALSKKIKFGSLLLFAGLCYLVSQICMIFMPTFYWYIFPLFICGLAQGLCLPIINRLLTLESYENHTFLLALNGSVFRLSQTIAPFIFGLVWSLYSWKGTYLLSASIAVLLVLILCMTKHIFDKYSA